MKKIFITGGAGYVGSVLTPYLINKGHTITVFDLMLYGDTLKKDKNLNIIKGDIRNTELLKEAIKGNEIVIHLACISNDPSFELNPTLLYFLLRKQNKEDYLSPHQIPPLCQTSILGQRKKKKHFGCSRS